MGFSGNCPCLWDYDISSPPILATITKDNKKIDIVTVVTKIGNTIILDRDNGNPIYDLEYKLAPTSKIPGEKSAAYQPNFKIPEPFVKSTFDYSDITNLSSNSEKNIKVQIRNSKYGFFEPPMLGGKITFFGIGGGAQWTGAAYSPINKNIYVPSVLVPWQIYVKYVDLKSKTRILTKTEGKKLYEIHCSSCHGVKREGIYSGEKRKGNKDGNDVNFSSPSLVGISFLEGYEYKNKIDGLKKIHDGIINLEVIKQRDLDKIFNYFKKIDLKIDEDKSFGYKAFWQELLGQNNCPGSKPPWAFLTAINLETGKIKWRKSEKIEKYLNENNKCENVPEHGQVLVTAGGILLAIFKKNAYFHDIDTGEILWSTKLSESITAPPTTYEIDNEQYILLVSSKNFKNHIIALKLK